VWRSQKSVTLKEKEKFDLKESEASFSLVRVSIGMFANVEISALVIILISGCESYAISLPQEISVLDLSNSKEF
jgi:hypothetical protein